MTTEIDLDLLLWKQNVADMILYEKELEASLKAGTIKKKEYKEIKKEIRAFWCSIWSFHPHQNRSVEQAFQANFC